jgi:putative colanic acid biosynthesis glycosyltransferase
MSTVSDAWVSIVTVVLNNRGGLISTEKSIRTQTSHSYQWIVVDGGSTDGSLGVVENSRAEDVKWISEADSGIYDAMNKGVEMASGKYALFLNAGDSLSNQLVIENIVRYCEHSHKGKQATPVIMGGVNLVLPQGRIVYRAPRSVQYMWHSLPTSHQAMLFPLTFLKQHKYDISYRICGDYYVGALAYKLGQEFVSVDFPIADFEVGGLSYQRPLVLMSEAMRVQRSVLKLDYFRLLGSSAYRIATTLGLRALRRGGMSRDRGHSLS